MMKRMRIIIEADILLDPPSRQQWQTKLVPTLRQILPDLVYCSTEEVDIDVLTDIRGE